VTRPAHAGAGVAVSALGFTVVVAWLIGNEGLTRVHPLFQPMPYSVAIGLSICGVALLAGAGGRRRLAGVAASIVLVLGLATLAQYGLEADWSLHRALLGGLIKGLPPGMALSTALSFVLVGVGVLAVSIHPRRGSVVCAISGTAVAAQNAVTFAWYGFGLASQYVVTGSAPHVTIGLAVCGVGTLAASWHRGERSRYGPPRWLPLPVALGIALISLSLWQQSESDRVAAMEETTQLRVERIGSDLNRRTAPLAEALVRLADAEAASLSGLGTIEPQVLSALDLERFPSLFALALVDRQAGLRWIQSRSSAAAPSLGDLQALEQACDVLLRQPVRSSPTVVDRSNVQAGGSGFVLAAPVVARGRLAGFMVGLFRYDEFFFTALGEDVGADYWVRVYGGQRELYRHGDGAPAHDVFSAAAVIPFHNVAWHAQIWPRVVHGPRRPLADWTLVFGLGFAGLLGWTVQLAQRSARAQNLLSYAKADLRSAIVARRAAQAARDDSEVRYKQIIDAAADIIYRTDVKGRFVFVNPAAIRVTRWSRDELIGRSYLTLIRPDRRDDARAFYERQAAKRIPSTYYDFPMVTADGQEVWIGQHVQLLVEGVRIVGFQAVARDINHRIRIQNELQRMRDAALETVRLKSAFVANTSHEIRTPLNGIIGFCNLLLDTDLSREQRTCAEGLRVSANALVAIVNDVLDFSKIEAGMLRLEVVGFDLRAAVNDAVVVFGEAAKLKQLALDVHIAEDVPGTVYGDPNRLRQVLANLLANAIKFTEHGSVTVRVEADGPGVVRFSITDTGIGIDADALSGLFQPFVQADVSTSRRYGGTGLGLAISRQIVELMGGSIDVMSTPGSGSTFWFTVKLDTSTRRPVPADRDGKYGQDTQDALGASAAALPAGALTRSETESGAAGSIVRRPVDACRILVADDNDVSQQVTRLLIEKLGYTVETASNGFEAVRAVASTTYSLVLMDCQMPVMDGYTAAAAIRRAESGKRHTPIVAFTASAGSGERERCVRAGMDDLLEKPVRKEELGDLLDRWARTVRSTVTRESKNQTAGGPSQGPVDLDALGDLQGHLGVEGLNRIIDMHLQEMDAALQRMQQLTATECAEQLSREAHRLRGGSMALGFGQFGALCETLEDTADRCTETERSEIVQRLKAAYADVEEWCRKRRDSSSMK
jgi:PAS domain S-box-containing protein